MASIFGIINEETPKFDLLKKADAGYEIRSYHRQLQAAVTFVGAGEGATTQSGFRNLAGYIFGGNKKRNKTDENDKIAMTAPVMSYNDPKKKTTTMSFILPSKYQYIEDLPITNNEDVKLEVVEPVYSCCASVFWKMDSVIDKHSAKASPGTCAVRQRGQADCGFGE
ncbi:SOUL-domain-containing protein [Hyaloscypha hepaticicola]|uniref:SOUL-domain-containing protein n=1 Tax=Hyaloscypha hepaticicola TaxID=2082293 RepID=A0A2J6QP34_9HELO|nr:SOUL-domain-containing protein [Hyaloscypha hepaticicola]